MERPLPRARWVCVALTVLAIWAHPYLPGTDLPQQANLFRLWTELGHGPLEYRRLFRVEWFTPYLLTYLTAYPLTKLFGALVAIKIQLTIGALGTYWAMTRWLRAIGGDERLGLFGLVLAFGFAFQCGFLANDLALFPMFGYLAAFESQGERPSARQVLVTTAWAIALFFTHGITFAAALVSAGLRFLVRRRPWAAYRAALHFIPVAAVTVAWLATRRQNMGARTGEWFFNRNHLTTLLSGVVYTTWDTTWALIVGAALLVLALAGGIRPRFTRAGVIPFMVALVGFLALPDLLADTWVVGPRFCMYVHAFAAGVVMPKPWSRLEKAFPYVIVGMVALALVSLNVRLFEFDDEMKGFEAVAARVGPYEDVETYVGNTGGHFSKPFGQGQFGQVPAWVTARNGGLIANDSAAYYQIPIQHNPVAFPNRHRYVITRGARATVLARVRHDMRDAHLVASVDDWFLFERRPIESGGLSVVRSAQDYGTLKADRAVTGSALSIGGERFESGFGTHAASFIRVLVTRAGRVLHGVCGVDDAAPSDGLLSFRIRSDSGAILFASGQMRPGDAARPFAVPIPENRQLLLEALSEGSITADHADWARFSVNDEP